MAARPIEQQMWADITKAGGPEALLDRISDGASMEELGKELGISRTFLSWKLNALPGMKERLVEARRGRADKWADDALSIADNVPEDPNAINKAKVRIETRKWLAGVDDPDRYGQKAAQVNISIGSLHLDALRRVQSDLATPISAPDVVDAEAEDVPGQ